MQKSDLLVIYIYQLMSALRKGKSSTISETDVFTLLGMADKWQPSLSVKALLAAFSGRSPEALLLFALVLAQQALERDSEGLADKATRLLLAAVDEIPALQSPALVDILQKLQALQRAPISA